MDIKIVGPQGEEEMEKLDLNTLSEFMLKKYLLQDREIIILTQKYVIANQIKLQLANFTLDNRSNVREEKGKFLADLMFAYEEYPLYEPYGKVINRKGIKLIKVTVEIEKQDIIMAAARIK